MDESTKPEITTADLLADLAPEDLEPRLELQLLLDPLTSLGTGNQNQNNGNQQQQRPPKDV